MRVLIRADANETMGTGHVMRMIALAAALRSEEHEIILAYHECPQALLDKLQQLPAKTHKLNDGGLPELQNFIKSSNVDFLVLDGYQFNEFFQDGLKTLNLPLLVLDDYGHCKSYSADIILNQNPGADERLYFNSQPHTRLLLGTDYVLLRPEFLAYRQEIRAPKEAPEEILISMGGADSENASLLILNILADLNVGGKTSLVIGAANQNLGILQAAAQRINSERNCVYVNILHNVLDMAKLLKASDLIISAGGTTVFEAAYLGVPNFVLQTADNQAGVITFAQKGAVAYLGRLGDVSKEHIGEQIRELLTPDCLSRLTATATRLIDGKGANRVLSAMLEKSQRRN